MPGWSDLDPPRTLQHVRGKRFFFYARFFLFFLGKGRFRAQRHTVPAHPPARAAAKRLCEEVAADRCTLSQFWLRPVNWACNRKSRQCRDFARHFFLAQTDSIRRSRGEGGAGGLREGARGGDPPGLEEAWQHVYFQRFFIKRHPRSAKIYRNNVNSNIFTNENLRDFAPPSRRVFFRGVKNKEKNNIKTTPENLARTVTPLTARLAYPRTLQDSDAY